MSRFLTPAKIGLLALIELYTEEAVPNDSIVPVIKFIISHLLGRDLVSTSVSAPADPWGKADSTIRLVVSIQDFEHVLGPLAAADHLPGRRLWDMFLEKLWAIDSLHALRVFFDRLPRLSAKTRDELRRMAELGEHPPSGLLLSRRSPFGRFVRKSHSEFPLLKFGPAAELWKGFVKYRHPTAGYWNRRNPHHGRLSFDSVLMTGEHGWGPGADALAVVAYGDMLRLDGQDDTLSVSTDDIESLLEFQIELIQKYGNRAPPDIRDRLLRLLKDCHLIPSLSHYLNFSDAWRSGEYPTSLDHLHRYFDYTMQGRKRLFYQYALMNVAIVQTDFGCHKEAVTAMLETVSIARENRDMTCLNFALNWFFHFGRAHPDLVRDLENSTMLGSGKETLAFLRVMAKETGMWILWGSALLNEAKLGLSGGESVSVALEYMVRSSHMVVRRNMKTMMGAQLSMAIALWDRLGLSYLSGLTCEVFMRCHANRSVFDDELRVTCRLAGLLAGRGKYEEAFEKLEAVNSNSLRAVESNQHWHLYRGILKLSRDLHRNNIEAADCLLSQLLQMRTDDIEADIVFVIDLLHVESLTRRGDYEPAFVKTDRLIAEMRHDKRDISLRIRLLLTKAHLFDRTGRPERGFTIAMRAASLAWHARLVALLWQAMGAIANVLNALSEFATAAELLVIVLPRCLETDMAYMTGTLYSLLADARMGQAGEKATAEGMSRGGRAAGAPMKATASASAAPAAAQKKPSEFLAKAHEALDLAFGYFSLVEDVEMQCQVLAKNATLMRSMGDHGLSEEYAAKYVALKRKADARNG
ncbi:anaphase-promoting complex subunit 5-domain-containing protein [Lasiosphaeria miniovina]|uniref:Anaphase-promoting complex subunit 5 n=1 Tax=Lasiosphaeria miniovina TaxID=1954250 RepID=A0AA40DJ96_9PEZI|nr:anaphase-promoting complex subunit 5-domain-containing protein [Lasiosphaeria miniovina]KAK0703401.1 anaphase-promoting complex subunit 5-domain-containing protein [Lasiosphaeria miniovina]